jgi:hypothetical protein
VITVPGYRISVQVPADGKPENNTPPVDKIQVGGVIVPTDGAGGMAGCEFITTFPEAADAQPVEFVTEKVCVPDGSGETVEEVPVPDITTPPGLLVSVHDPDAGNPLRTTLPVEVAQVGWVIFPATGADGAEGCGLITTFAVEADTHPSELVTINV